MTRRAYLAWFWTLVILLLCWLPRFYMPIKEHGPKPIFIPNIDKAVHLGIFALWAFLWMGVGRVPHQARRIFLAGLAFTITTEVVQELPIISRDANLMDGIADMVGVCLGIGSYWLVGNFSRRKVVDPEV